MAEHTAEAAPAESGAFTDRFGLRVSWELFVPDRVTAGLLFLPGANVPGRFYRWLAEGLLAAGIATMLNSPDKARHPDRDGRPSISGRLSNSLQVAHSLDFLYDRLGDTGLYLAGHSQGGSTVLESLIPAEGALNPRSGIDERFRLEGPLQGAIVLASSLEPDARRALTMPWRSSTRPLVLVPPVPVLAIAGTNDPLAPPALVERTARRLQPPGEAAAIEGANHFNWCAGKGLVVQRELDGPAGIPPEAQRAATLDLIAGFVRKTGSRTPPD